MRFRKRPVEVDAEQYQPGTSVRGVCTEGACSKGIPAGEVYFPHVHTIHQGGHIVPVEAGDWILPEPTEGFFYPVKNDIFLASYVAVEEAKP
jgi:hypothetical protein